MSSLRRACLPLFNLVGCIALLLCVFVSSHAFAAAPPQVGKKTRQVLMINSYTPTYAWTANIVSGVRSVLDKMDDVELSIDYMDTKKIYTPKYAQLLADMFTKKYAKLKFDLIISSDDDALDFLLKYRDTVFPGVPVVFSGVNNYRDGRLGGQKGYTGVNEANDYEKSFDWIAKHRPGVRQILIVTDDTATSASYTKHINAIRANWDKRFNIRFTGGMTIAELQQQLRGLQPDTVVFWAMFMRDKAGEPLSFGKSVKMVVEASPVPVFGFIDIAISQGATGGYVASGVAQGQMAARLGQRILAGEAVDNVPILLQSPNVCMFDYRSMQRWGITPDSLPAEAEVLNRPVTFYQQYKHYVWAALGGMGAETAIIVVLILMIRTITSKNRRKLRESEDRYRSIVEDGNELICRLDSDAALRFVNGALGRFVERRADELVGSSFWEALSIDSAMKDQLTRVTLDNPIASIELECHRADGESRWVLWNCHGFFSDGGTLAEIQAVGHDITERRRAEAALHTANTNLQGVLDGMQEALIVCDRNGRLGKIRSRATTEWFGAPTEGMSIVDYLFNVDGHAKAVFKVALTQICEDVLPFEMNAAQLPRQLRRGERTYRVECRQMVRNGSFEELIFVLSDVTAMLHQERVERMNRELPAIVGNLMRDREGFQSFVQDANELLAKLSNSDNRAEQRRVLHTLKGNTAIYGFEHFASRCHALEDAMDADDGEPNESSIITLSTQWREALDSFGMFLTQESAEGIELDAGEYQVLLEQLEQRHDHAALLRSVKRWAHPRMEQVLGIYARTVKQLAARFQKEVEVEIVDNGLRLPRGEMRWFLSVLVHVVRNAVDHGIESPEVRAQANKPKSGHIRIESSVEGSTFVVAVADDGCGIPWDMVRKRAMELNLPCENQRDLEAALFHDGFTTKASVSDISGRGVGLGAVIDSCKQLGGIVTVQTEPGRGTRFEFRFVLPSLVPVPYRPIAATRPTPAGDKREAG